MDKKQLIKNIQNDDISAFNELYKLYCDSAMRTAYFISGNRGIAEDIVQETFVICFKQIKTLKDPEKFEGWFHSILVRIGWRMAAKCKSTLSYEENFESFEGGLFQENVEEQSETNETKRRIKNVLNSLSVPMRTVIILYYYNELSIKDIAKILGCFEGTVKSRLHKARKLIRVELLNCLNRDLFELNIEQRSV